MLSRFAKLFLVVVFSLVILYYSSDSDSTLIQYQLLVTTLGYLHPKSRAYIDPWTGELFGEGGLEKELFAPPKISKEAVKGDVIMSKLGNATAKYAVVCLPTINIR